MAKSEPTVTVRNVYAGKGMQVVGMAIFLFCGLSGCVALMKQKDADDRAGDWLLLASLVGLVLYVVGRFKHWYHAE